MDPKRRNRSQIVHRTQRGLILHAYYCTYRMHYLLLSAGSEKRQKLRAPRAKKPLRADRDSLVMHARGRVIGQI